jgi:pyroglutamyl-peptidase
MGTILVTGFEPFGGDATNPSQQIAAALEGRRVGAHRVRSTVLPVEHRAARSAIGDALLERALVAVLHLGLAGGRARIALEQIAVNVLDYSIPDAAGARIRGEPCVVGGPPAYFSTLPSRAILAALTADGLPAYLSYTAGTYLCNQTLYWTLHEIDARGLAARAGFIHVPFLPSMVAAHALEEPSMDLATMVRAVEVALGVVAEA